MFEALLREQDRRAAAEAHRAYLERKAHVANEFAKHGVLPWMQYQVCPNDLPFPLTVR